MLAPAAAAVTAAAAIGLVAVGALSMEELFAAIIGAAGVACAVTISWRYLTKSSNETEAPHPKTLILGKEQLVPPVLSIKIMPSAPSKQLEYAVELKSESDYAEVADALRKAGLEVNDQKIIAGVPMLLVVGDAGALNRALAKVQNAVASVSSLGTFHTASQQPFPSI